jgi:hypothetical protein
MGTGGVEPTAGGQQWGNKSLVATDRKYKYGSNHQAHGEIDWVGALPGLLSLGITLAANDAAFPGDRQI